MTKDKSKEEKVETTEKTSFSKGRKFTLKGHRVVDGKHPTSWVCCLEDDGSLPKSVINEGQDVQPRWLSAIRDIIWAGNLLKPGIALHDSRIEDFWLGPQRKTTSEGGSENIYLYDKMDLMIDDDVKFVTLNFVIGEYMGLRAYGDWNAPENGLGDATKDDEDFTYNPRFHYTPLLNGNYNWPLPASIRALQEMIGLADGMNELAAEGIEMAGGEYWIDDMVSPVGHWIESENEASISHYHYGKVVRLMPSEADPGRSGGFGMPTIEEFEEWVKSKGIEGIPSEDDRKRARDYWREWKPKHDKHMNTIHKLYVADGLWTGFTDWLRGLFSWGQGTKTSK